MATDLNFSTGKEHRISLQVSGWTIEEKAALAAAVEGVLGVVSVRSAGGGISYYVDYDPSRTTESALKQQLTLVAEKVQGLPPEEADGEEVEPNYLAIGGDRLMIGGQRILAPRAQDAATATASSWTGIADIRERIAAVKQLVPVAIVAIDTLILELDVLGDNGGPALDERQEALEALRGLHCALGSLLALAETPNFKWADNEGLASECVGFAARAQQSLRDDPLPFATASLILAICTALHFPGAGALLANFAFSFQKPRKR